MKKTKKKIGLVIGDSQQIQYATLFEPLHDFFDMKLYTFENPMIMNSLSLGIPSVVFPEDPKMPGYMKDLENCLSTCDAVVAVETSRLSSFQALRSARKNQIPISVLTGEFRPFFYRNYKNIRAIQSDIYNKASRYWALSHAAASLLNLEAVSEEFVRHIGPRIRFLPPKKNQQTKRDKFRKYIGLTANDTVILVKCDLEKYYDIPLVIQAFHHLKSFDRDQKNVKLILCGQGTCAQELKYKAYDYGLGKDVIFIQQDMQPFKYDLLSASDLCIKLHAKEPDHHEEFSFWLAEAISLGVIPLIESGASELEFVSSATNFLDRFSFCNQSPESLSALMVRYLSHSQLKQASIEDLKRISQSYVMDQKYIDQMVQDFEQMLVESRSNRDRTNINEIIGKIETELTRQEFDQVLCTIEELLLNKDRLQIQHLVALLGIKGDAHFHNKQTAEAESAYSEGLGYDPHDSRCLRGLGSLFWQSHSHEQALGYFKKALQKNPEDALSFFGIGMIYSRLGLHEDAAYWLQKAVESQPIPPGSLLALAQTCASLDLKGLYILQAVIDSTEGHPVLFLTLGQMYLSRGDLELGNKYIAMAQHFRESSYIDQANSR